MKKKILVPALALTIGLLSACGSTSTETVTTEAETIEATESTESASSVEETELETESSIYQENESQGTPSGNGGGRGGSMDYNMFNSEEIQSIIAENAPKYQQFTYTDAETGIELEYSLYVPKDYDASISYPLVTYIPDSSSSGKSASQIVSEYYGASAFITDEMQEKHASFVLVPAFSETVVDDDFNTSEQIDVLVKLIDSLCDEYSIDTNRLYITGQSMGGMTSFYLNSIYPDKFVATLYVSSQWDINVLSNLENQNFFYIVAASDEKASAGQDEVMAMFDADNVPYTFSEWSAQDDMELQDLVAEELIMAGLNANMIRFTEGSVLEGVENTGMNGMEHMFSFNYGYSIPSVIDWLFTKSK